MCYLLILQRTNPWPLRKPRDVYADGGDAGLWERPVQILEVGMEFQGPGHLESGLGMCGLWVDTSPWPRLLLSWGPHTPHRRNTAGPLKCLAQVRAPFCLCLMSISFKPVAIICYFLPLSLEAWIGEACFMDEAALLLLHIIIFLNNLFPIPHDLGFRYVKVLVNKEECCHWNAHSWLHWITSWTSFLEA